LVLMSRIRRPTICRADEVRSQRPCFCAQLQVRFWAPAWACLAVHAEDCSKDRRRRLVCEDSGTGLSAQYPIEFCEHHVTQKRSGRFAVDERRSPVTWPDFRPGAFPRLPSLAPPPVAIDREAGGRPGFSSGALEYSARSSETSWLKPRTSATGELVAGRAAY